MVSFGGVYNRLECFRKDPTVTADVIETNPNFVLLLASGPIVSSTQRARVETDVVAIHTATSGAVRPDIGANVSWNAAEDTVAKPGIGNYDWERFLQLQTMAGNINVALGLARDSAVGCKWWVKLFHRNYDGTTTSSTPIVPRYMQQSGGVGYAGGTGNAWSTGGSGASLNGEYEGTLSAGNNAGTRSRAAKLWVPDVAARLQAWLIAIGTEFNNDPTFAGVIINETSPLAALANSITGMSLVAQGQPAAKTPTSDQTIMYMYFQNFFGAVAAARPSLSKKELMISANNPVASIDGSSWTMFTMLPLNPSVLYTQHQIGNLVQDAWGADDIDPKFSVKEIYRNNQPHSVTSCSYAALLSPDTRRHKGVNGSEYYSATSVNPGTGIPGNKGIVVTMSATNGAFPTLSATTMEVGKSIVLLHDVNKATQAVIYGTISAYNASTGGCTVNATSATGTGARTGWEVGIPRDIGEPNYLPPHTLDELVTYAVTARLTSPSHTAWNPDATHLYEGATHVFFQVTSASTGTSEGQLNYVEYVEYLKTTANRPNTTRPLLYPT